MRYALIRLRQRACRPVHRFAIKLPWNGTSAKSAVIRNSRRACAKAPRALNGQNIQQNVSDGCSLSPSPQVRTGTSYEKTGKAFRVSGRNATAASLTTCGV